MKRKQLLKVLKERYQIDKLSQAFEKHQIMPTIRAEALSLEDLLNLYNELN